MRRPLQTKYAEAMGIQLHSEYTSVFSPNSIWKLHTQRCLEIMFTIWPTLLCIHCRTEATVEGLGTAPCSRTSVKAVGNCCIIAMMSCYCIFLLNVTFSNFPSIWGLFVNNRVWTNHSSDWHHQHWFNSIGIRWHTLGWEGLGEGCVCLVSRLSYIATCHVCVTSCTNPDSCRYYSANPWDTMSQWIYPQKVMTLTPSRIP